MTPAFRFPRGVMLVGGGDVDDGALSLARERTGHVVAADGGANALAGLGLSADAVIGDLDSLEDRAGWEARGTPVLHLSEQDTTDFEKCLYATEAPFYLGVGFTGRRFDHTLAALHALLRWPFKRVVLIGAEDAIFLPPLHWQARLAEGARVSFFPLRPVMGLDSEGLEWPIHGLGFAPGERIGTSNRAVAPSVSAQFDVPGMAAMVARDHLDAVLESLHRSASGA
jgi:thiamine pyrophosphokinase